MRLPIITGVGGVNPAGRSSMFHSYRRTVIDALDHKSANETYLALASMMELNTSEQTLSDSIKKHIREQTLIRKIDSFTFDPSDIQYHVPVVPSDQNSTPEFILDKKNGSFADELPDDFEIVEKMAANTYKIRSKKPLSDHQLFLNLSKKIEVSVAGTLPTGFNPGNLYHSINHPRGIQMAIYAASDAIYNSGFTPEQLMSLVPPDLIGVYASSSIGQTDDEGIGGYSRAMLEGKRPTSRQLPMGMPQMSADFINAYILGNVGATHANIGACATFLYNLSSAVNDIKNGRCKIAIVGCSEAAVNPNIIRAYWAMSALSSDSDLMKLDNISDPSQIDFRRACRPFSDNKGFVLAESAQFIVLFDDELAVQTGANVYGSVPEVYINADGFKTSISRPGIGNYISFAKAVSALKSLLGETSMQSNTAVYAHGTGTPQNRVSESKLMSDIAKTFQAREWAIVAIKCFLGHSTGPASGDQLNNALGIWQYGILPGIKTVDHIADDVFTDRLKFNLEHTRINPDDIHSVLINSKGFGGNNATGILLSPQKTKNFLTEKFGRDKILEHAQKNEYKQSVIETNEKQIVAGELKPIYTFKSNSQRELSGEDIIMSQNEIKLPGYSPISLNYNDKT